MQAKESGKASDFRIADYALDHLGDQPLLMLPTHSGGKAGTAQQRGSGFGGSGFKFDASEDNAVKAYKKVCSGGGGGG